MLDKIAYIVTISMILHSIIEFGIYVAKNRKLAGIEEKGFRCKMSIFIFS
jgi:hypothetical protein